MDNIMFSMFLIFSGGALLATIALYTRQSLLVAYILLGVILGPWGLGFIDDPRLISKIANFGIIFLLFLLGLNLHPQNLINLLKTTIKVTSFSSLIFILIGFFIPWLFGYSILDSLIIGITLTFSSTIIGLKLLPTTILHHQRMGEIVISILLLQDLLAIVVLMIFKVGGTDSVSYIMWIKPIIALPILTVFCFIFERYVFVALLTKFDKIQEYIFLLAIGWCMGVSELASYLGLSHEIGAFIAGVSIATSPIALYIAESLKPLRDFFLILFFFSLGASFNLSLLPIVWLPAVLLAAIILVIKPIVYWILLKHTKESASMAKEIGVRLGQSSEFSLLVAYIAKETSSITDEASYLIQVATILTFIVSSYYIVMKYPTPIALSDKLRRD